MSSFAKLNFCLRNTEIDVDYNEVPNSFSHLHTFRTAVYGDQYQFTPSPDLNSRVSEPFTNIQWEVDSLLGTDKKIAEAKDCRVKDILIACFKTAVIVSLLAVGIFASVSGSPLAIPALWLFGLTSGISYIFAANDFSFPERRLSQTGSSEGPWHCPNPDKTTRGKVALFSVVWPALMGTILPIYEAVTKESRWTQVREKQKSHLEMDFFNTCEDFKGNAQKIYDHLKTEKAEDSRRGWSTSKPNEALECLNQNLDFFRKYDDQMPATFPPLT